MIIRRHLFGTIKGNFFLFSLFVIHPSFSFSILFLRSWFDHQINLFCETRCNITANPFFYIQLRFICFSFIICSNLNSCLCFNLQKETNLYAIQRIKFNLISKFRPIYLITSVPNCVFKKEAEDWFGWRKVCVIYD